MAGVYNTSLKNCVVPHYKQGGGEVEELFRDWKVNTVFEGEKSLYEKYGDKMSTAISGLCLADMFTQYGLTQKDDYIRSLFKTISCFKGKDSVISYLVATRPYRLKKSTDEYASLPATSTYDCPDNIVFKKHTLIVPRGELLWSLLSIPGEKIGATNNPNNFKICIKTLKWEKPSIPPIENIKNEFKSHQEHLRIESVTEKEEKEMHYVTLNPYIYTRIKAYRCVPGDGRSLEEQYLMIHKMNLLYAQTLGALALIPVKAERLLQYPPATRESICSKEPDRLHVVIPNRFTEDIDKWANKMICTDYEITDERIYENTIFFPDAKNSDECGTNRDSFHNFIQAFERSMTRIRDEYRDTENDIDTLGATFDANQRAYWYKFIKNTYPSVLNYRNELISNYTPNCTLTPLGVVAVRDICEGDPLIFGEHKMDINHLHELPNSNISNYDCLIERLEMPAYERVSVNDPEKVGGGFLSSSNRVQASPLAYTSAFVTSLGTNITILPR